MDKLLSVVVSVYNEEQALPLFYQTAKPVLESLPWDYEILFVNDGSQDGSLEFLRGLAEGDSHVKVIGFSRNFGHEAAMIAGIDYARGDGIVCMDADLQHPPACLPEIVEKLGEGCGVITMVRTQNASAGVVKNITSAGFYWLINTLSDVKFEPNASDFLPFPGRQQMCCGRITGKKSVFCGGMCRTLAFGGQPSAMRHRNGQQGRASTVSASYLHSPLIRSFVFPICR